jgi:hypothetical protein
MTVSHDVSEQEADRPAADEPNRLELASEEIRTAAAALTRARQHLEAAARGEAPETRADPETSADRAYAVAELRLLADMALDLKIQVDTARALAENVVDSERAASSDGRTSAAAPAPATERASR